MKFIDLANKLFESRQMVHIYHLSTHDEATHRSLNIFYEEVLGLTDDLIETYMGQFGLIEGYELITNKVKETESLEYLENLVKLLQTEGYKSLEGQTHLSNILDEIVALTYRTIYRIKILNK